MGLLQITDTTGYKNKNFAEQTLHLLRLLSIHQL